MNRQGRAVMAALASLALAGCTTNQSGDFGATTTGDLSHPLAERRAPDIDEQTRCGPGGLIDTGAPFVHRAPYLQRVSAADARLLWTADDGEPASVEVAPPAGGSRSSAAPSVLPTAEIDGATPGGGAVAYESAVGELRPDTLYCYQLWNDDAATTLPAGFRTAPEPGVGAATSFVAFGDSGFEGADQAAVLEQLQTVPFRLMIHTGDIAYESGTMNEFERTFFDVYAPLLQSFPMYPAIGNHDSGDVFRQVYDLPRQGGHNWYSFDHGDVHFVALDTNDMSAEQAAWLDADLTSTDREWKVVYGHHPPYSSGTHGSSIEFRDVFGPTLARHRVDLVLSGHDHDYERMTSQDGVHYVVTGGGGRGTRPVGDSDFTAFSEQVLHFVYVEVQGDELLLHAIDANGEEFDQLAITHTDT